MNAKTAKMLRQAAGVGNRQAYRALKREWGTLSQDERAKRRRAAKAKDAKPAAKSASPNAE